MRAAIEQQGVNQAELARRAGITRARVTQLLHLLKLGPAVCAELRRLAAGGVLIPERRLRPLFRLPPERQLAALRRAR